MELYDCQILQQILFKQLKQSFTDSFGITIKVLHLRCFFIILVLRYHLLDLKMMIACHKELNWSCNADLIGLDYMTKVAE